MISYIEARALVAEQVSKRPPRPAMRSKPVNDALGDVLAKEIRCDRDYPPFDRSTRDGYAVHANQAAIDYLRFISDFLQVEIGMISTGPERDATIVQPGTLLSRWL